jgi:hypothetical protein
MPRWAGRRGDAQEEERRRECQQATGDTCLACRRYDVIVDKLVPTYNTVTAHAHEYEYGATDSWTLRVWAVCGDPIGAYGTTSTVSESNSDNKGVTVRCADDLIVTCVARKVPESVVASANTPTARAPRGTNVYPTRTISPAATR